jgi:ubiquinone/menaquinone biosynthesis C-methylase UbiE
MPNTNLFSGTAHYYARYRPPYPDPLLSDLLSMTVGQHARLLLDLGCGTGEVAIPLSSHFAQVTAVDIEPQMVAQGQAKATDLGITNIDWAVASAEETPVPGDCDLITVGAAFHWMDRELLAKRFYDVLRPGHAVAVLGTSSSPWSGTASWHSAALEVIHSYLGPRRRAGSGHYTVEKTHEDYLRPVGFNVSMHEYPAEHTWTADEFIGYLYSTSFVGAVPLGDVREQFERDMRAALLGYSKGGRYTETLEFYFVLALKP